MVCLFLPQVAGASGPGALHKLGVYRISSYGETGAYRDLDSGVCSAALSTKPWKPMLPFYKSPEQDPMTSFWPAMTSCTDYGCANAQSRSWPDAAVTHDSIVGPTGRWQDYNMVFFLGHNNTIANDDGPDYFIRLYNYCSNDGGWKHRWYENATGAPQR